MAKKKTQQELEKLVPSRINKFGGRLTIVKNKNNKYFCFYPIAEKSIKVTKGLSIYEAMDKMYKQLIKKEIILLEPIKKKKKINKIETFKVTIPLSFREKRKRRLAIQNKLIKQK